MTVTAGGSRRGTIVPDLRPNRAVPTLKPTIVSENAHGRANAPTYFALLQTDDARARRGGVGTHRAAHADVSSTAHGIQHVERLGDRGTRSVHHGAPGLLARRRGDRPGHRAEGRVPLFHRALVAAVPTLVGVLHRVRGDGLGVPPAVRVDQPHHDCGTRVRATVL